MKIEDVLLRFLQDEIESGRANAENRDEYNTAYFNAVEAVAKRLMGV